jgi:hypothetical protein
VAGAKKPLAFPFVVEELCSLISAERVRTRPMFGCHALYVDEKIIFMLRRKDDPNTRRDDGLWVAMSDPSHARTLRKDYGALRELEMFRNEERQGFAGWLNLPCDDDGFEDAALSLCRRVAKGDPRLGKVPKPKRVSAGPSKRR